MRIEKGSLILYLLPSALKTSSEKPTSIFHTLSFSLNIKIFNIEMTEKEHLSKAKVSLVTFFFLAQDDKVTWGNEPTDQQGSKSF